MIRQGDVLLVKIKSMPEGLKQKSNVLAFGEVTGHNHRLVGGLVFADRDGKQFCKLESEGVLEHEDHAHISIPKGVYEVRLQREFDILEGVRQVMD